MREKGEYEGGREGGRGGVGRGRLEKAVVVAAAAGGRQQGEEQRWQWRLDGVGTGRRGNLATGGGPRVARHGGGLRWGGEVDQREWGKGKGRGEWVVEEREKATRGRGDGGSDEQRVVEGVGGGGIVVYMYILLC